MPESAVGRIVCFGDLIDDVVVRPHGPIRTDTDTPSTIEQHPGGSAANTASWLGSIGAAVDFVGTVGADDLARHTLELQSYGVTPHLASHPTLATGAIVVIVQGEERTMLTSRGANAALDPAQVTDAVLASARVLHLTGHSIFHTEDTAAFTELISRARAAGVDVSVDPGSAGFLHDFGVERFLAIVEGANIVVPNLEEGRVLTGEDEPELVASSLATRFDLVALTLDAAGVIVATPDAAPLMIPAVITSIVDPTGAGDAFTAGFLHGYTATGDTDAAARAGASLASRAVSVMGARPRN
ncbi:MAG: carbohydrate kinase family protein [Microbacteriaceae bacterium]